MFKGVILVSPDEKEPYLAFLIKSQITDNRPAKGIENIADEIIQLVCVKNDKLFYKTSSAKLIDLKPLATFAKSVGTPEPVKEDVVSEWCFENITLPQFEQTKKRIETDIRKRKQFLDEAFNNIIFDITNEINELQGKVLTGDNRVIEKIQKKQLKINDLSSRRNERHAILDAMTGLSPKTPEILGCIYVVPLTQVEYSSHFGMKRDDEVEMVAMDVSLKYEKENGWIAEDVASLNLGYDIRSVSPELLKRYIEVKGRSREGGIMLSENEMNRLGQLGDAAWLYIVVNCKSSPNLIRINNPVKKLKFELKSKGVQYFLPEKEWKK